MEAESKRVLFHIPADLLAAFDRHCRRDGRQRSEALRTLVAGVVGKREPKTEPIPELSETTIESAPTRSVHVRLKGDEVVGAERAAIGYRSVAGWITGLVRREILCAAMISNDDRKLLIESNAQLRRIGINLNQIAHRVNVDERSAVTDDDVELLHLTASFVNSHSKRVESLIAQSQQSRMPNE